MRGLCSGVGNCDFVRLVFNSEIVHALRIGVNYAIRYKPDWLLFLDDDTVLMSNAVGKALGLIVTYRGLFWIGWCYANVFG